MWEPSRAGRGGLQSIGATRLRRMAEDQAATSVATHLLLALWPGYAWLMAAKDVDCGPRMIFYKLREWST